MHHASAQCHTSSVHHASDLRHTLTVPPYHTSEAGHTLASGAPSEASLMACFVAHLGWPWLEPNQDIKAAGATSLQLASLATALGVDLRLLLALPSVRRLAAVLRAPGGVEGSGREDGSGSAAGREVGAAQGRGSGVNQGGQQAVGQGQQHPGSTQGPGYLTMGGSTLGAFQAAARPAAATAQATATTAGAAGSVPRAAEWEMGGTLRGSGAVQPASPGPPTLRSCVAITTAAQLRAVLAASEMMVSHSDAARTAVIARTPAFDWGCEPYLQHPLMASCAARPGLTSSGDMSQLWRQPLGKCVDAAPVALTLICRKAAVANSGIHLQCAAGRDAEDVAAHLVFACSHSGLVCCCDGVSGTVLWKRELPGRCDAGLAIWANPKKV
ncbi:hypothetical protein V8C86DRAFT_2616147 [Haematococcus lacustris]